MDNEAEKMVEEAVEGIVEDKPADDFFDKYQRALAEFDNYRKRTAREKAQMYDDGVMAAAAAFLPVIDNLDRALSAAAEKEGALYDGLAKVAKQAAGVLDTLGIEEIPAQGKPFDANLHDAVMHGEDDTLGEQTVAEVFQKGYTYRGRVIRHSMVKVVN